MELFLTWSLMIGCAFADYNDFFDDKQPARAQPCDCGWSNKGRIINGKETVAHKYPWMVALQEPGTINAFCGGVILTTWHIITAAHCTYDKSYTNVIATIGAHNLNMLGTSNSQLQISAIIQHKKFERFNIYNDVSLLVVENPIKFSKFVGPACLPKRRIDLVGQSVKALGWGHTEKKVSWSDVLMEADLGVVSMEECRNLLREAGQSEDNLPQESWFFCTNHPTRETYDGDSGGPLLWLDPQTNRYTIVGLISCGSNDQTKVPGVHTEIASYLGWIKANIQKSRPGRKACLIL